MYLRNGLKLGYSTVINDITYTINWLDNTDPETLVSLGITKVADPQRPDPVFYTYTENPDGSLNIVSKSQFAITNELEASKKLS